jgi:hypothetical protein
VANSLHGVVCSVGMAKWTESPSDFSMYFNSWMVMAGCFLGFSNDSHSQKAYLREVVKWMTVDWKFD